MGVAAELRAQCISHSRKNQQNRKKNKNKNKRKKEKKRKDGKDNVTEKKGDINNAFWPRKKKQKFSRDKKGKRKRMARYFFRKKRE